ncbi:hypothetical protein ACFX2A_043179 [Malus domestica]
MAADLLLSPPFSKKTVCLHHMMQSAHLYKGNNAFSVCLPKENCSIKFFMVPVRAFALCWTSSRTFASVGYLDRNQQPKKSTFKGEKLCSSFDLVSFLLIFANCSF